jgi:8-oxo-dGTP pyrophosphatase MutT (NUDIX family)
MLTFRHTGDWGPGDIEVAPADSSPARVPEVEALVERAWQEAKRRPGVQLFDGPMTRLEESGVRPDGRLYLVLSRTSYKHFLGTNLTRPDIARRYGPQVLANPVGLSAALETTDGYLLLGRRTNTVAYYPGRIHPFAGALEPGDGPDVFGAVLRELHEELSLERDELDHLRCAGLVEDDALRQPELIFLARCRLSRRRVEENVDPVEHHGVYAVPATAERVGGATSDPALTPVAVASLLLWGRARFGDEWFRTSRGA